MAPPKALTMSNSGCSGQKRHQQLENAFKGPPEAFRYKRRRTDNNMGRDLHVPDDYTVGWLCALPLELGAAKGMLDEEHEALPPRLGDSNNYTLGRIGQHNVVLACLPGYGIAMAASSAMNMLQSFPKIQIGLMVGIGGGVPGSQSHDGADVRLGDVVVGERVIQHDMGKTERNGYFKRTGVDSQPPNHIVTAVNRLRGDHKLMPSKIPSILAEMFQRHPFMKEHYARPTTASDQLFDADYEHFEACDGGKAATCDNCNSSRRLARPTRRNEHPVIHYGKIASGNQVIKHGVTRDRVAGDLGALCFDMEAAGLADAGFRCLVVRGISDYADSHKNSRWQEYAAAAAAAYAKELLSVVPASHSDDPKRQKDTWEPLLNHLGRMQLLFFRGLQFDEIAERQGRIMKAFQTTFEWIYQKPGPDEDWSSFVDWLENGEETYWITGKPGSGKSTLMKFLQNDKKTKEHLHIWSNEHRLVTAGFYFWNSGTELQMSTLGLLRSLIYLVFQQCPDLIPFLCPERWEALYLIDNAEPRPWTTLELRELLLRFSSDDFSHMRFFFIIDGLDEFIGDHDELIQLTRDLVACKHIKACVASRPWTVFQQVFGKRPNLMLQHLTVKDIEIFVRTTFNNNDDFRRMHSENQQQAESFLTQIMNRSSGVFLWVRLVTQSLLRGISNGDKISDLQKRLDETPENLEDLFQKILDTIEPRYRQQAAELFQIHRAHPSISALRISFADEESHETWSDGAPEPLTMDEFVDRCDQIRRRIDSRTMGLLELDKHDKYTNQEYG